MRNPIKATVLVLILMLTLCAAGGLWLYYQNPQSHRVAHHKLSSGADSSLGTVSIPENHMVDDSFTSHLPLIIIDTNGQKIVNYKFFDSATQSHIEPEGIDPYVDMTLFFIDNPDYVNRLGDPAATTVTGRIKVRGNYSSASNFSKKQYAIRLFDSEGNEFDASLLGMAPSSKWVLNGTQADGSYMRNYVAMNMGGELFPYTPDMRYCEAVLKSGDQYEYLGLFILYETIGRGKGRVDITKYNPEQADTSYILRRDRYEEGTTMLQTWALENGLTDTWFEVQYPGRSKITQETVAQITDEINTIEQILYSDDYDIYSQYPAYLDVDSFVDYFIVNELFGNYDAGDHSTYLYKEIGGKLSMAALWDYDMAMDNWDVELLDLHTIPFVEQPWFDRLILDPAFTKQIERRYQALRLGLFSDENLSRFFSETEAFLGNAILRDHSRWAGTSTFLVDSAIENRTNLIIDRSRNTPQEEIQRVEDVILLHAEYLDNTIGTLSEPDEGTFSHAQRDLSSYTVFFILMFFTSVIVVQRYRRHL